MKPSQILATVVAASAALTVPGQPAAASDTGHAAQHVADVAPQSEGEVRKLDLAQGKITLRHGPLVNLDMPGMTMVFKAADPALLVGLKVGDMVRFTAEQVNGVFTVTALRPAE